MSICLVLPLAEHQYYNGNSQEQGFIGLSWREDMPERKITTRYSERKPETISQQIPGRSTTFISPEKLTIASLVKSGSPVDIGKDLFVHRNVGLDLDSFRSVAKGKRLISSSHYEIPNTFENIYLASDEDLKLLAFYAGMLVKSIKEKPQSLKNVFIEHNYRNNDYAKRDELPGSVKSPETMRLYCDPCIPFAILRKRYYYGYFWIPEICFVMVYENDICISFKYYQEPKISSVYKLDYPFWARNDVVRDAVKAIAPQGNIRYLTSDKEFWSIEVKYDSKKKNYFDLAENLWDAIYASLEKELYNVCDVLEIPTSPVTPEKFAALIRQIEKGEYSGPIEIPCSIPYSNLKGTEKYKRYQKYLKSFNPKLRVAECEKIFKKDDGWIQPTKAEICDIPLRTYQDYLNE